MVEREESLNRMVKSCLENYLDFHKEKSEKTEKIINEKVSKYVNEKGFSNEGINKEKIIRDLEDVFHDKILTPITDKNGATYELFQKFNEHVAGLMMHHNGGEIMAENLSDSEIEKIYNKIITKEKRGKNE